MNIYVPTYKKKNLTILRLIQQDKDIHLTLCVRRNEYESGFYDYLKDTLQVSFLLLDNVHDIGETRQQILEYSMKHDKYCIMFDDTVLRLIDIKDSSKLTSTILEESIKKLEKDELYDNIVIFSYIKNNIVKVDEDMLVLTKKELIANDEEEYFAGFPCQVIILNNDIVKRHNLRYIDMECGGLEDTSFVANCLREGLIFKFCKTFRYDAEEVNIPKVGGNHTEASDYEKVKIRYDLMHYRTYKIFKDMMGISMQARYKKYMKNQILFLSFDWDYYRKLLVYDRNKNQDIIDNKLSLTQYLKKNNIEL